MKNSIFLFSFLFATSLVVQAKWDQESAAPRPKSCIIGDMLNLPTGDNQETYWERREQIKKILRSKGYALHNEVPCGSRGSICYGVDSYLDIQGSASRKLNGKYNV